MFSDRVNIELGRRSLEAFADFGDPAGRRDRPAPAPATSSCSTTRRTSRSMTAAVAVQNELGVPSRMIDPDEAVELSPADQRRGAARRGVLADRRALHARGGGAGLCRRRPPGRAPRWCRTPRCGRRRRRRPDRAASTPSSGRHRDRHRGLRGRRLVGRVGALAGVDLPVTPLRRQILVTEPVPTGRPRPADDHRLQHRLLLPPRRPRPADGHERPGRAAGLPTRALRRLAAALRRGHGPPGPGSGRRRASAPAGPGCTR